MRHCDGAFGLLFFGQADALAGISSGARDAADLRKAADGEVLWNSGEFGTMSGTQILVNWSSVSPPGHAVIDGVELPVVGTANIATAGAAAIATANPPARISR